MANPFSESIKFVFKNFLTYLPYMVIYYVLAGIPTVLNMYGIGSNQMGFMWISLLVTVLYLWLRACILYRTRELKWNRELTFLSSLWEGACATPAFLLYTVLHAALVLIGLVMLVIPGIYFLVTLYFAPILSVIEPDCEESYFSLSMTLVKNHFWMVFGLCLLFLFGDSFSLLSQLIKNETLETVVSFVLLIPECLVVVFVDVLAVHIYMKLRNDHYYQDQEGWEGS